MSEIDSSSGAFSSLLLPKSRSRLKFSNVPAKLQWCALSFVEISKIQFWYYFTGMEGTTTTSWFLHYCIIFKTRSSHSVILWTFMEYIGALNVYVDTQPKLNIHKTYMSCVHWESCIYSGFFYKNIETGESHAMFLTFSILRLKMFLTCSYFLAFQKPLFFQLLRKG